MLIVNVMYRGQTKPIEIITERVGGLYDLLTIFEEASAVVEYKIQNSEGSITNLDTAFGWSNDWPKLVETFDWSKNLGTENPHGTLEHIKESSCIYGSELCTVCKPK